MLFKNKIKKNQFGYLKAEAKRIFIRTIILFGISVFIFILGIIIFGSKRNLFTLIAVLGALPFSQTLVNLIMLIRARKKECSEELMKKSSECVKDSTIVLKYDFYMTSEEGNYDIQVLTVFENSIIGYSKNAEFNHQKFEKHLNHMLAQNNLKASVIKIFTHNELNKFTERLSEAAANKLNQNENDLKILRLMENLSL